MRAEQLWLLAVAMTAFSRPSFCMTSWLSMSPGLAAQTIFLAPQPLSLLHILVRMRWWTRFSSVHVERDLWAIAPAFSYT